MPTRPTVRAPWRPWSASPNVKSNRASCQLLLYSARHVAHHPPSSSSTTSSQSHPHVNLHAPRSHTSGRGHGSAPDRERSVRPTHTPFWRIVDGLPCHESSHIFAVQSIALGSLRCVNSIFMCLLVGSWDRELRQKNHTRPFHTYVIRRPVPRPCVVCVYQQL